MHFINTLEKFIRQNKIKEMPIGIFYEVANQLMTQDKQIVVKQLIMNLSFDPEEMDVMMDYCLNNKLNIAMVNLGVNATPP